MSDDNTKDYALEEGMGRVQDGAEGLFSQLPSYDEMNPAKRCAATEAVRDVVIDQPFLILPVVGIFSFIVGGLLRRRR